MAVAWCVFTSGCKSKSLDEDGCRNAFRDYKQPAVPSVAAPISVSVSQSSRGLTAVLDSSIVIVEGVTLALIDKGGRKNPS